jgi:exopolyphosphatase/guanosine-5'-triphosphate,3'-diphosphate pyrophosphatase
MVVMEIQPGGKFRKLDRASRPIQLGRDVFLDRLIGRDSIVQSIKILTGFAELFGQWGIEKDDIFVIATTAIREAKNRDTYIDRIFIRTGFRIEIVEGVEENNLTFIAVLHAIEDVKNRMVRTSTLIIEVGGGSTELMIMDQGRMIAAHVFRLGTLRFERQVSRHAKTGLPPADFLQDQFRTTISGLKAEFDLARIKSVVMVGGDARTAAGHCGQKMGELYSVIEREAFLAFIDRLSQMTPEDCVKQLNITYYEAESLLPALGVYRIFLLETAAKTIIVPDVSIREGVLLRFALGENEEATHQYQMQVTASSMSLGRKYHFDEAHGMQVATLCMLFYEAFRKEHGMGDREKLYLQVAALLHDIGYFIRATGHHKHGQYIIQNSEIFGLSLDELNMVAQIVRYHRTTRPLREHAEFNLLDQEQRLVVLKLSAILRIGDALDRSHHQRVKDFTLVFRDDEEMLIEVTAIGDIEAERQALKQKGDVFEDVFGYRLLIK